MKLYLNTDTWQLSLAAGSNQSTINIPAKLGTTLELEILPDAPLGGSATGILSGKKKSAYTSSAVVRCTSWTPPSTSGAGYIMQVNLNTIELVNCFSQQPDSVPLMADITIIDNGTHKTQTFAIIVGNQVSGDDEGTPSQIPDLKSTDEQAVDINNTTNWQTPHATNLMIQKLAGILFPKYLPDVDSIDALAAVPTVGLPAGFRVTFFDSTDSGAIRDYVYVQSATATEAAPKNVVSADNGTNGADGYWKLG